MKLDQILGTISLPLEHDDLSFALVPFSNARTRAFNKAMSMQPDDRSTDVEAVEASHDAQINVVTAHLRDCLTDGKAQRVTPKWVSEQFPHTIIVDLVTYFRTGSKPEWAREAESGN